MSREWGIPGTSYVSDNYDDYGREQVPKSKFDELWADHKKLKGEHEELKKRNKMAEAEAVRLFKEVEKLTGNNQPVEKPNIEDFVKRDKPIKAIVKEVVNVNELKVSFEGYDDNLFEIELCVKTNVVDRVKLLSNFVKSKNNKVTLWLDKEDIESIEEDIDYYTPGSISYEAHLEEYGENMIMYDNTAYIDSSSRGMEVYLEKVKECK